MIVRRSTYEALQARYRREVEAREEVEEDLAKTVAGAATVSRELNTAHLENAQLRDQLLATDIPVPAPAVPGKLLVEGGRDGYPTPLLVRLHRERQARHRTEQELLAAQDRVVELEALLAEHGIPALPTSSPAKDEPADESRTETPHRKQGAAAC